MKPRNLTWHELIRFLPSTSHIQIHPSWTDISPSSNENHREVIVFFSFCRNHFQGWYLPDSRCTSGSTPLRRPQHGPGAHVQPQEPGPKAKRSIRFFQLAVDTPRIEHGNSWECCERSKTSLSRVSFSGVYIKVFELQGFSKWSLVTCAFMQHKIGPHLKGRWISVPVQFLFPWNSTFTKNTYCSLCFKRKKQILKWYVWSEMSVRMHSRTIYAYSHVWN